ncbi:MAG: pyridoxal 5'-phosphate synthase glutaminase subunit PdxT [Dehalococcoidia bacterium]|nr:pyridoxal 5'-phosphate synthase glutaminase subunit PdxT [Dehalococcoidia bacterium]
MRIGVLASQGAFIEHLSVLRQLKVEALPVRLAPQLDGLDGLIIPSGESTAIGKLMLSSDLTEEIKRLAQKGLPIFGTCAGMIVLATRNSDQDIAPLGVMNIVVKRNAFGRQRESFETELSISVLGEKPFPAVFIRAPLIEQVNGRVEILARPADGTAVAARQGKLLVSAFHPELTDDLRFHRYFLDIVRRQVSL